MTTKTLIRGSDGREHGSPDRGSHRRRTHRGRQDRRRRAGHQRRCRGDRRERQHRDSGFVDTHRHTLEAAIRGQHPMPRSTTISSRCWTPSRRPIGPRMCTPATWPGPSTASMPVSPRWSTGHTSITRRSRGCAVTALRGRYPSAVCLRQRQLSLADYWFNSSIAIPGDDVRRIRRHLLQLRRRLAHHGLMTVAAVSARRMLFAERSLLANWTFRSPSTLRWAGCDGR